MKNQLPTNQLPAVHPGEFLAEILEDTSMTVSTFSRIIGVPVDIDILKFKSPITAELALSFGNYFGQSKQYWLNLQAAYDLKVNSLK